MDVDMDEDDRRGSITEFSAKLQKALRVEPDKNFVYSPLGVSLLMGMTQLGSTGNTAKEIAQTLGFSEDPNCLEQDFKNASELLMDLGKSDSDSFVLRSSQRIFIQKFYDVHPEYVEKLVHIFDAGIHLTDFVFADPEKNAEMINGWVEKTTEGKIKECIQAEALKFDPFNPIRLLMVNTVYFHGKWLVPFEANQTRKEDFYVNDGRKPWEMAKVDMMHGGDGKDMFEYVYLEKLDADVVKLTYKNRRFSMIIFIPKFKKGLTKIQENISTVSLGKCLAKLKKYKQEMDEQNIVFVFSMPKFKFETELNLVPALQMLGIKDAFVLGPADFSGITDNPEKLFVSAIAQKAIIEVDELGTTAAAVTRLTLRGGGCPEYIQVKADRSFYFQIVDEELEIVIFSGAVIDPTKPN